MSNLSIALSVLLIGVATAYNNIAGSGVATQTDNFKSYSPADKATDGNTNGVWNVGAINSIAMTKSKGPRVFWKVRFNGNKYIDRIVIWNRLDYRTERIDGMRVYAGSKLVGTLKWECARQAKYTIANIDTTAREVKLLAPNNANGVIAIAEVEVFGAGAKQATPDELPEEPSYCEKFPRSKVITNIAAKGVATQIDDYNYLTTAPEAIDGNTYAYYTGNAATSMQLTKSAIPGRTWWKLTFPKPVYIERIVVYNRLEGNQNRMQGQIVQLDGEEFGRFKYTTANQAAYPMTIKKTAQEIKMIAREGGDGYLQMAEVEVFGEVPLE